MKAIPVCVQTT